MTHQIFKKNYFFAFPPSSDRDSIDCDGSHRTCGSRRRLPILSLGHVVLVTTETGISPPSAGSTGGGAAAPARRIPDLVRCAERGGAAGSAVVVVVVSPAVVVPLVAPAGPAARVGRAGGRVLVDGVVDGTADVVDATATATAATAAASGRDNAAAAAIAAVVHAVHLNGRGRPLPDERRRPTGQRRRQPGGGCSGGGDAAGTAAAAVQRGASGAAAAVGAVDGRNDIVWCAVAVGGGRPVVCVGRRLGGDGALLAVEVHAEHEQSDHHDEAEDDANPGADGGGVRVALLIVAFPRAAPSACADILRAVHRVVILEKIK